MDEPTSPGRETAPGGTIKPPWRKPAVRVLSVEATGQKGAFANQEFPNYEANFPFKS